MTNEQILKKAIEKAVKNGFNMDKWWGSKYHRKDKAEYLLMVFQEKQLIFSHDFAKAFFGKTTEWVAETGKVERWQIHLQQMVIADDPIKYLERFINPETIPIPDEH